MAEYDINSVDRAVKQLKHACTILVLKFERPFKYLLMCLQTAGSDNVDWLDASFNGVWSESTLFAYAYLPEYLG